MALVCFAVFVTDLLLNLAFYETKMSFIIITLGELRETFTVLQRSLDPSHSTRTPI